MSTRSPKIKGKWYLYLFVIFGLLAAVWGFIRITNKMKHDATPVFLNQDDIGVFGPIQLQLPPFTDSGSESFQFVFEPEVVYSSQQSGDQLLVWFDSALLQGEEYLLRLIYPLQNGDSDVVEWRFTPRHVEAVFMKQADSGSEIWRIDPENSNLLQITTTNNNISGYDVSPDGNEILLSVKNKQNGADIWIVDRTGEHMRQLVACNQDVCSDPDYLPKKEGFAYLKNSSNSEFVSTSIYGIFVYLFANGESKPLFSIQKGFIKSIRWSPDGEYLTFLDGETNRAYAVNRKSGNFVSIPCEVSEIGSWSSTGDKLIIVCLETNSGDTCKLIKELDMQSNILGNSPLYDILERKDYSTPAWSYDGKWVVFGERCINERPTKQIWLVDTETWFAKQITDDVRYNFARYQWNPNNDMIIIQRFEIGVSSATPDIVVWKMGGDGYSVLAKDGHSPAWLP